MAHSEAIVTGTHSLQVLVHLCSQGAAILPLFAKALARGRQLRRSDFLVSGVANLRLAGELSMSPRILGLP